MDILLHSAEETLAEFYSQEWPFAVGEDGITTVAPYTTGTIAAVLNSAAIVGTGTNWNTSWPTPAVIRPEEGGESFIVLSFNSTTGLTLDRPWPFTSDASMTYQIEFPCYDVSEYIALSGVCLAQSGWRAPLHINNLQSLLYNRMQWTPGGYPCEFFLIPGDGTTSAKLVLNPAPAQVQTLRYRYTRAVPTFRCYIGNSTATGEGGVASLANGATAVTGTSTLFQKVGYSMVGHYFEAQDQIDLYALISAVGSDTGLTVGAWTGQTMVSQPFYVSPKILMPDDFRPMLRDLMRWKTFQNSTEYSGTAVSAQAESRYRRNLQLAWRRVNRMRQDRDVKPVDIGGSMWPNVEPPGMPWQLTMNYAP